MKFSKKNSTKSHALFHTWIWGYLSTLEQLENSNSTVCIYSYKELGRSKSKCEHGLVCCKQNTVWQQIAAEEIILVVSMGVLEVALGFLVLL